MQARLGDRRIAVVRCAAEGALVHCQVFIDPSPELQRADLGLLLRQLAGEVARSGGTGLVLRSSSLVLRHEARAVGFVGGLRRPLHLHLGSDGWQPGSDEWSGNGGEVGPGTGPLAGPSGERLVAALAAFGIEAVARHPLGPVGRLVRGLVSGVSTMVDLAVTWAPGRTVVLAVPDQADLMPEAVAVVADTASAVLRRFAAQAGAVRRLSFDRSEAMLTSGRYAGMAKAEAETAHLTVDLVAADAAVAALRRRAAEGPRAVSSLVVPDPFTALDGTVAHELWHLIEHDFLMTRSGDALELYRCIGQALGVETLEQVTKGRRPAGPPAVQVAFERLVTEVSGYAATNPREATAELFKAWWCRGATVAPVVARFGELLERFFPPPVPAGG